jgi:phage terminase large subunit
MAYGITTAYKKISKLDKRIRVVPGGTSAGKTIAILLLLLDYATRHKGKLITIAAANYPHLRRGALRDFKNILNENNYWKYYGIEYNKSETTFTLFNGTVIEFVALNEYTARGARRDVLFVNEANLITYETFQQLEIRTKEFCIVDYNPTSEFWANTELVAKRDDVDFLILTYKDNEALDPNIVKSIESRKDNKNWWRVYGLGLIGELEGLVYSGWKLITDIPKEAELLGYGLDFGYTNDPTAIAAVYKYDGGYILDERCYRTAMFNNDIADLIKNNQLDKVLGVADSSEPKSIDEIYRMGILLKGANKTSGDKTKSYNQWAISKIQELNISYTANSTNLQKEYLSYMWQTDKTGKNLNIPQDGQDHILDAVKYKLIDLITPKVTYGGIR